MAGQGDSGSAEMAQSHPPVAYWGLDPSFWGHAKLLVSMIHSLQQAPAVSGGYFYRSHPVLNVEILGLVVCVDQRAAFTEYTGLFALVQAHRPWKGSPFRPAWPSPLRYSCAWNHAF